MVLLSKELDLSRKLEMYLSYFSALSQVVIAEPERKLNIDGKFEIFLQFNNLQVTIL